MEYKLICSDRKTLSILVKNGDLIVRAPMKTSINRIEDFIKQNLSWIEKNMEKSKKHIYLTKGLGESEIAELKKNAKVYFEEKTRFYSKIMNVKYGRITITSAKIRFGSCSSKGNICYAYRLMLYPEEAREYVVVHELAHCIEMNHSKAFYRIIESILPDYKKRKKMLEN